jgi:NTE family protein
MSAAAGRTGAQNGNARALILGGGGVTGIAWELGIILGLADEGVYLNNADAVIGTSAGAFVATEITSGVDLEQRYAGQFAPPAHEISMSMTIEAQMGYMDAIQRGAGDPVRVAALLGCMAMTAVTVSARERALVVAGRLPVTEWPDAPLRITAVDADSGTLHVLDRNSGLTLTEAVTASGAVPGVWPMVTAGGRKWIDGGVVSPANAHLGAAFKRVVVIAPASITLPGLLSLEDHISALRETSEVGLITPDTQAREAIGDNVFDPSRRGLAATAGRLQGRVEAAAIRALW